MTRALIHTPDPRFDLVLERVIDVPRSLVWQAWTRPEHILKWFTPAPWQTVACEIDLRPGGLFRTVMRSPEGEEFPNLGCYLEVIENERLIWTNLFAPGFRPAIEREEGKECAALNFTAVVTLEDHGAGTKYTALVIHGDEKSRASHEEMGFNDGWGAALDQLVALVRSL